MRAGLLYAIGSNWWKKRLYELAGKPAGSPPTLNRQSNGRPAGFGQIVDRAVSTQAAHAARLALLPKTLNARRDLDASGAERRIRQNLKRLAVHRASIHLA